MGQKMDDLSRIPVSHCPKVFVQRDYSNGTTLSFQTKFPQDLEGKVDAATFQETVTKLNSMYLEAETLSGKTYCESCLACLTAYLSYICFDTHYEKMLKKIRHYIDEQNQNVYVPRGLMLIDPVERGLRVLEICVLSESSGGR
ncbi:golgin subfamily A member 7-like [Mercenaria mercenaria]|uniref:golgin subfamily A member 7-like n=1 Tax=Mercenaria mercenaria TaxID=6596 RepID=UPI001E1D7590|nr:golgin subfamily A member 7-like [Mercenaria mercenaria]